MSALVFFGKAGDDGYAPVTGVNLRPESLPDAQKAKGVEVDQWPPADVPADDAGAFVNPETGAIIWRTKSEQSE